MIHIHLLSPITGSGTTEDPYHPQFADDFPGFDWSDISEPGDTAMRLEVFTQAALTFPGYPTLLYEEVPDAPEIE